MLLHVRHFAESASMAVRQKHGVIAEPLIAAWGPDEGAVHRSVELFDVSVGPSEAKRADRLGVALARRMDAALSQFVFHRLHGAPEVLFGTRPARLVDAWLASEGIDVQSRIVRERRHARVLHSNPCL